MFLLPLSQYFHAHCLALLAKSDTDLCTCTAQVQCVQSRGGSLRISDDNRRRPCSCMPSNSFVITLRAHVTPHAKRCRGIAKPGRHTNRIQGHAYTDQTGKAKAYVRIQGHAHEEQHWFRKECVHECKPEIEKRCFGTLFKSGDLMT